VREPPEDLIWAVAYAITLGLKVLGCSIHDPETEYDEHDLSKEAEEIADIATTRIIERLARLRQH